MNEPHVKLKRDPYADRGWAWDIRIGGFMIYRAGWTTKDYAKMRGRWWIWVGPYVIGWGWG